MWVSEGCFCIFLFSMDDVLRMLECGVQLDDKSIHVQVEQRFGFVMHEKGRGEGSCKVFPVQSKSCNSSSGYFHFFAKKEIQSAIDRSLHADLGFSVAATLL